MTDINDPANSPAAGTASPGAAASGGAQGAEPSYPASPGQPPPSPSHAEPAAASAPQAEKPAEAPRESSREADPHAQDEKTLREPFPFLRLLAAVFYGVLASIVFWIVILLAALQFITIAVSGEKNDELDRLNRRMARYMQELFDYIMLSSDKKPFPFGPVPPE